MAAREHHAKQVIFDRAGGKEFFNSGGECPFAVEKPSKFRRKARAVRSRRRTSSARFFAVAMSHAEGFSGMP